MSDTTNNENSAQTAPDPSTILCRIVDVDTAIQNSFQRFLGSEGKTLEELANLIREELSKMELFAPNPGDIPSQG